jgi:hypothetical protein
MIFEGLGVLIMKKIAIVIKDCARHMKRQSKRGFIDLSRRDEVSANRIKLQTMRNKNYFFHK